MRDLVELLVVNDTKRPILKSPGKLFLWCADSVVAISLVIGVTGIYIRTVSLKNFTNHFIEMYDV